MYPVVYIIDADEVRAQRVGRLLCLADYRPIVASTPYQAFDRALQESAMPVAILLGQRELLQHHVFARLLQHFKSKQQQDIPLFPLPPYVPEETLVYTDHLIHPIHLYSEKCARFLLTIETQLPQVQRRSFLPQQRSLVLQALPTFGLEPHSAQSLRSRNNHFHQLLVSAYELIGETRWTQLIGDVGLAHYQHKKNWPANNNLYTIPAVHLSCLHQAVAFSSDSNPNGQIRIWSSNATEHSLHKHRTSPLALQIFKLLSQERRISIILNGFVNEMNEIRGEKLHSWKAHPDGSYWLVHYSNLYAYGRSSFTVPACSVWVAALEHTLKIVGLDNNWTITEKECSCNTLTGHCLFVFQPKHP